jgi:hypothetical protein
VVNRVAIPLKIPFGLTIGRTGAVSRDRGSVCPTYSKPFDLFAKGNETGDWRRESPPAHVVRLQRLLRSSFFQFHDADMARLR